MNRLVTGLICTLLMAGCSTLKVTHDFDPTVQMDHLESFAFTVAPERHETLHEKRIRKAIRAHLDAKGYEEKSLASADFHIQFESQIDEDVPGNFSFGFGLGTFTGHTGLSIGTSQRLLNDEGMLIVDMLAPETAQTLWRGSVRDRLRHYDTPEEREKEMQRLVDALLDSFPTQGTQE